MEFVEGKTLHDCIGRKGLPVREALKYAVQSQCAGGGALRRHHPSRHQAGNIMVTGPAADAPVW